MKQLQYLFFSFSLLAALLFAGGSQTFAQTGRVKAIKVSFLSERLALTPAQAEKFWPIYNQCSEERRSLRQPYKDAARSASQDTEEAMRQIDNNMEYKEKELALQKRCNDSYLKVISPQQVASLMAAERDFRAMLLKQIKEGGK
jgi:hypothetical protein